MLLLTNPVRDYAWGSTRLLPDFLGRPGTGRPQAELWIGAHAADPSRLPDGTSLGDAIAAAPQALLGPRTQERFGDRLPFLMKVLAVDEPLSLQVHPTSLQARQGFEEETARGLGAGSAARSFPDPWHKPELVFALSRFEGMAGFRDLHITAGVLRLLNLPWSDELAARLVDGPAEVALREVTTYLLGLSGRPLRRVLRDVGDAARHAAARGRRMALRHRSPGRDVSLVQHEAVRVFTQMGRIAERYPEDPGVLVTLLLNHVVLAPGEAMFVDAGVVHAYTSGLGVEIMAASDNVVRAGLTPKHTDVARLLAITRFEAMTPPRWPPAQRTRDFVQLRPPVADFTLAVGRAPLALPRTGPRLVLALGGRATIAAGGASLDLRRGQAVFVGHDEGPLEVTGIGNVAVGGVPDPDE